MADSPTDFEALYLEEQRRREEEQRRREEEQRRREKAEDETRTSFALYLEEQSRRKEEQRRRKEEQRRREKAENLNRKTTLPEFLDGCHTKLHWHLNVQLNKSLTTQGNPANADNKLRPDHIRPWENFAQDQERIWTTLMESSFPEMRLFTSLLTLEESGETIEKRMLSSETDLHHFLRSTVEDQVTAIVEELHGDQYLREQFHLRGSVSFENHANMLNVDTIQEGMRNMNVNESRRRRSPRLQTQNQQARASQPESNRITPTRFPRPRADQFCVYNTASSESEQEQRVPAYISELKPPHKLPLNYIQEGLGAIDLDDIVIIRVEESVKRKYQHLLAAVITQAFSYMVQAGLEYGCIQTGEATIFLRVPEDPRTVYYYLSVPKGDVGETTGWSPDLEIDNRLHLTAVGQMLAFTLRAMSTKPRAASWRSRAFDRLKVWAVEYEQVLERLNLKEPPSSEYQPSPNNDYIRISPIKLRKRATHATCAPMEGQFGSTFDDDRDDYDNGGDSNPDTPSRLQRPSSTKRIATGSSDARRTKGSERGGSTERYCTHECLLGLRNGGLLDKKCPNVQYHGKLRHRLNRQSFLKLIEAQFARDLDQGCEPVGRPGTRGVLFKVTLFSHGYTLAAKGSPSWFSQHLCHEAHVYDQLEAIQGKHVPVHVGNIKLLNPYPYVGVVFITDMMLLSFGGRSLLRRPADSNVLKPKVEESIRAVHRHGVLQGDADARNILWNGKQAMIIDFERATVESRIVLGKLSSNRKREREENDGSQKPRKSQNALYSPEVQRALRAVEL